jgi:hypothetical protein
MSSAREARRPLLAQGFNNLKARGVQDILVLCGDGLPGLPDAVRNVFPRRGCATVTTRCDTAGSWRRHLHWGRSVRKNPSSHRCHDQ